MNYKLLEAKAALIREIGAEISERAWIPSIAQKIIEEADVCVLRDMSEEETRAHLDGILRAEEKLLVDNLCNPNLL